MRRDVVAAPVFDADGAPPPTVRVGLAPERQIALIWPFSAAGNALIGNKQGQEGRIA
jgi:hypothetical protein